MQQNEHRGMGTGGLVDLPLQNCSSDEVSYKLL